MSRETLQDLTRTRKWAHQKLIEKGSGVYKAFLELEKAAFTDGALKKREKELIAIDR
ncbi:MAG: hypothetical protein U5J82_07050 [Desulfobacterales bacterium]|nr:hypothetical protein [Desulfobacterales bacterium]